MKPSFAQYLLLVLLLGVVVLTIPSNAISRLSEKKPYIYRLLLANLARVVEGPYIGEVKPHHILKSHAHISPTVVPPAISRTGTSLSLCLSHMPRSHSVHTRPEATLQAMRTGVSCCMKLDRSMHLWLHLDMEIRGFWDVSGFNYIVPICVQANHARSYQERT